MSTILNLPCLRGVIGDWIYFTTVMKVKDVVNRVITVSESEELYTSNINEILQREINNQRIGQIKDYILNNKEHFFSSIITAIYKGSPIWSDFDIESHFRVDNNIIDSEEIKFIENKIGILSLSGDEIIFALDGQHRIVGIREAYNKDTSIGDEEISIIIVVHNSNNKQRTRRLFTVLNKYAQKPKEAELIILDEDDTAAIITRKLVENHRILSMNNAISSSNVGNIPVHDNDSFTTLVTVNRINKIILNNRFNKIDYTKRPNTTILDSYYTTCENFWNFLFDNNPWIKKILNGIDCKFNNGDDFRRNTLTGGNILLRPIGQKIFAQIYNAFDEKNELDVFAKKIPFIDFNLNGYLCKYITWYDKIIPKSETLQKRIFYHVLGLNSDKLLINDIINVYEKFGVSSDIDVEQIFKQI